MKAVFLDRDGVVNHDPGDYTKSLAEFELLPDALAGMKLIKQKGYKLILVTNQGGVAKGLYTKSNVEEIHDYLQAECRKQGFELDAIYYAPYHDDFGNSLSRKPGSLMVERGLAKFNLTAEESYIIGDKQRDLDSGAKVGVNGILIDVNGSLLEVAKTLEG